MSAGLAGTGEERESSYSGRYKKGGTKSQRDGSTLRTVRACYMKMKVKRRKST